MASAEDLIIIYVAGHGVHNEQNLYFMTHDAEISKPYTGMQINQFQSFLRSRPINQKALFLMNICHACTVSGVNRRGSVNAEDAIKQLSEGTGTIVFASSTGTTKFCIPKSTRVNRRKSTSYNTGILQHKGFSNSNKIAKSNPLTSGKDGLLVTGFVYLIL